MSLHASIMRPVSEHCATEPRLCSAPFEKGGYGGFAFALVFEQRQQKREQEQIPLNPPFSKAEAGLPATAVRLALP